MAAVATSAAAVAAPGPAEHDPSSPGPRWSAEETERFSSVELAKVRENDRDPASPAEAFRAAGEGERLLDEMELACCWLQHEAPCAALPLPRFRVTARPSKILEPELRQMANVLRRALDRVSTGDRPFPTRALRAGCVACLPSVYCFCSISNAVGGTSWFELRAVRR